MTNQTDEERARESLLSGGERVGTKLTERGKTADSFVVVCLSKIY